MSDASPGRIIAVSFRGDPATRPLPRSIVSAPLEAAGATQIDESADGVRRFHAWVDGTSLWIEWDRGADHVQCLVEADGSPASMRAAQAIVGACKRASEADPEAAIEIADEHWAPPDLYLQGYERLQSFDRALLHREEAMRLRWDLGAPSDDEAAACNAILSGDLDAVRSLAGDPVAIDRAVRAVARRLFARASASSEERRTDDPLWSRAQIAAAELARLGSAFELHLAVALLEASLFERFEPALAERPRPRKRMDLTAAAWLSSAIPRRIAWELDNRELGTLADVTPLRDALWRLPGAAGTRWIARGARNDERHDELIRRGLGTMLPDDLERVDGGDRAAWSQSDACDRLDALAEASPKGHWLAWAALAFGAPSHTALAQCRLADAHSRASVSDSLVDLAAKNIAGYLSGDVALDVELFDWDAPAERRDTVRRLLELAAGTEGRVALVSEALNRGLVSSAAATYLCAETSDEAPAWRLAPPVDLGEIDAPDGRLAAGSALDDDAAWIADVSPGAHGARLITATSPSRDQANAALEILVDAQAEIASWESLPGHSGDDGFSVDFGVGVIGSPAGYERAGEIDVRHSDEPFGSLYGGLGVEMLSTPTGDRVAAFAVMPQHGVCRAWIGRALDGSAARIVIDLDLVGLDPPSDGIPWT